MKPTYFINPAIDALPAATGEERTRLIRLLAANIGDEAALRTIIGIDPEEFAAFYPDMKPRELSTDDTIDGFISRFSSEAAAGTPEVDRLIAAPAVDYALLMEEDDADAPADAPEDSTSDLISSFLAAVPPKTPSARRRKPGPDAPAPAPQVEAESEARDPETPREEAPEADPELSEALFRLMVRNRNYRKALEIINELSLNNPKKSIYFAYQIRFLEKLIKNQEKKTSRQ